MTYALLYSMAGLSFALVWFFAILFIGAMNDYNNWKAQYPLDQAGRKHREQELLECRVLALWMLASFVASVYLYWRCMSCILG